MLAVLRSRKNSRTIKIFMLRDNLRTGVGLAARISACVNSIYRQSIKKIQQPHGKTINTYQLHLQKPRLLQ